MRKVSFFADFYRERGKPHIDLPISDFGLVGPPLDLPVMDRGAARIFLRELGVRKIMGTALDMNENYMFRLPCSDITVSGGWRNNPSASDFKNAYRHVIHRCGASPGQNGNVVPMDPTSSLNIPHLPDQLSNDPDDAGAVAEVTDDTPLRDHDCRPSLSTPVGNIVVYIAGFAV